MTQNNKPEPSDEELLKDLDDAMRREEPKPKSPK